MVVAKQFETEFDEAASGAEDRLTEASIKNYKSSYKRLLAILEHQIHTLSQEKLIACIANADMLPEPKNQMVSVSLLIRRHYGKPVDKIINWRFSKLQPEIRRYKLQKKEELKPNLPSIAMLNNHMDELYRNKECREFIINYLLINLGFRNMDLNLILTRDKDVIKSKGKVFEENYLYITKSYARAVINDYKTKDNYGQKKIKIRDNRFMKCAMEFLGESETRHLLDIVGADGVSRPIEDSSIHSYIQTRTYNGLGEGRVFKAIISEHCAKGNMGKVEKLSLTRGTAIDTIIKEYNCSKGE